MILGPDAADTGTEGPPAVSPGVSAKGSSFSNPAKLSADNNIAMITDPYFKYFMIISPTGQIN